MVEKCGADAFRLYEMFMGAFDQPIPWSTNGLIGMSRFLGRVWELQEKVSADAPENMAAARALHRTIQRVSERMEATKFNTAIASLMELANEFWALERIRKDHWETFLKLLAPFAPHVAEELWQSQGHDQSLARERWPQADPALLREDEIELPVQVDGKLRSRIRVAVDAGRERIQEAALADDRVRTALGGREAKKVIIVAGRMVNIVAG
jgi:leucyl-tRNA synthetase